MNYLSEMSRSPWTRPARRSARERPRHRHGRGLSRVTALAFQGPGKTLFMISWQVRGERFDEDGVPQVSRHRHSLLLSAAHEVLLARDIMNKQIVDTQGMKVVRVNDTAFRYGRQPAAPARRRGARGLLRAIHPLLERVSVRVAKMPASSRLRISPGLTWTCWSAPPSRLLPP